jgi:hypothetical protein
VPICDAVSIAGGFQSWVKAGIELAITFSNRLEHARPKDAGRKEIHMAPVKFTIVGNPTDLTVSQCTFCAHRSPDGTKCRAYPNGIPVEILFNEHDHSAAYQGDNGILYQPVQLGEAVKVPA